MADIENSYLTAPLTERVWTLIGPELGDDAGNRVLIVRALYGLKSSDTAFRNHISECMKYLGWIPHHDDGDLLMKKETFPADVTMQWAYILIYVDDILCVHNGPSTPVPHLPS
jgi:hypothetical protein